LSQENLNVFNLEGIIVFKLFLMYILFLGSIFSQGRSDFFDNYDYNLRNYQGGSSTDPDYFREYNIPPKKRQKPVIDPKNIQKQLDPMQLIAAPAGITRRPSPTGNVDISNSPINPLTGDLNVEAILKRNEDNRLKKEAKKNSLKNREVEIYTETSTRRGEIIFFTTLPFAIGVSIVTALGIDQANKGFYKSNVGSLFVVGLASGLSFMNVYMDSQNVDFVSNQKKLNPNFKIPIEFMIPIGELNF
jgi:hypothetical protein